jgi:putative ABC transport system substrate-binding protein
MRYPGTGKLRRRDVVAMLAGAAVLGPSAARTQDRIRSIGMLMNLPADHPDAATRDAAFRQTLQERGWADGRNMKIEYRWGAANVALARRSAAEVVALAPDVIVAAASGLIVAELQRATHSVPIVFAGTIDPVVDGYVTSLARPGGNITGFSRIEYGFSAKWLELLKQIAPQVTRAAILRDFKFNGDRQFAAIEAAASSLTVEPISIDLTDADKIEPAIAAFASKPNGGLILTAGTLSTLNSALIVSLAAKHRLPAVYPNSAHVARGGLVSYGPSVANEYRRAADYVDRILRGAKPSDLPVQMPTSYEMVLNLRTARTIGLEVPYIVQVRTDQVVE